jgi:shikimate kinase
MSERLERGVADCWTLFVEEAVVRIYLTGFMGSGKSTVGLLLAGRLGVPFVDLDTEIERQAGMTVREIFEIHGEAVFRQREHEALRATLEAPDVVVATGGGTMVFEGNFRLMQANGLSVWLNPAFATIVARIGALGKSDRPLFRDEAQALALYKERLPAYRRADLTVDTATGERPEEIAARIALRIGERRCAI